jgi:hypothetical protein
VDADVAIWSAIGFFWDRLPDYSRTIRRRPFVHRSVGRGFRSGLGSFGMHHLAPDKIVELGRAIRERTDKPFALNIWVSTADAGGDLLTREQYTESIARFQP